MAAPRPHPHGAEPGAPLCASRARLQHGIVGMARIPDAFIDDLLARSDIVEVVGARVPLKRSGRNYLARCPFHNEKTPSFSVSREKQFYYCFGCGAKGTAISFLMDYDRLTFAEAIETLADTLGLTVPTEGPTDSDRKATSASIRPLIR